MTAPAPHSHCGICGEEIRNIHEAPLIVAGEHVEDVMVGECACGENMHDFDGEDFCWCEK